MEKHQYKNFKLYHYWRSSSSWRVRYALELKSIAYEKVHIHLLNGESESEEYLQKNPAGFVPTLEFQDSQDKTITLTESLPIIEFLEEEFPTPHLLPLHPVLKSKARALAEAINAGIQPIQNVPVLERAALISSAKDSDERKKVSADWAQHFIQVGLKSFDLLLKNVRSEFHLQGSFCLGAEPTLPDLFLIPQIYNAIRYSVNPHDFESLFEIYEHAQKTKAYQNSEPSCFANGHL